MVEEQGDRNAHPLICYRYEEEQQWAVQQNSQPSFSQPQSQSRFAQEHKSQNRQQLSSQPQTAAAAAIFEGQGYNQQSSAPEFREQNPLSTSLEADGLSSSLLEGYRMQQRAVPDQGRAVASQSAVSSAVVPRPPKRAEEEDDVAQHQTQLRASQQHSLSEVEQQGGAVRTHPAKQPLAAYLPANRPV